MDNKGPNKDHLSKDNVLNKTTEILQRCPACKSTNISKIGSWTIGGEYFVELKCENCGREEMLDEYQLEDWYS